MRYLCLYFDPDQIQGLLSLFNDLKVMFQPSYLENIKTFDNCYCINSINTLKTKKYF